MPTILEAIKPLDDVTKLYVRPSWADARLLLAQNEWTFQRITVPAVSDVLVYPANPRRWGIIFVSGLGAAESHSLYPDTAGGDLGFDITLNDRYLRLTVFDYGPIVQAQWFDLSNSGGTLGVYELSMS
jgi:hypothetical protein